MPKEEKSSLSKMDKDIYKTVKAFYKTSNSSAQTPFTHKRMLLYH